MSASELPPLPDDVAAVLRAEREVPSVSASDRKAVLQRVTATVAATTVLTSAGAASGVTAGLSMVVKVALAGAVLAGSAVGVRVLARSSEPARAARSAAAQRATPVLPRVLPEVRVQPSRVEPPPQVPVLEVRPAAPLAPPPPVPAAQVSQPVARPVVEELDSDLGLESALLESAREALVAHNAAVALNALRTHRSRFARGRLSLERDALEVQALVLGGSVDAARRAAERFERLHPNSVLLPVVRHALGESQ